MLHRSAPFRHAPDAIAKAELEAAGLGDPTVSLHRSALQDFYGLAIVFLVAYIVAIMVNLGEIYHALSIEYEDWQLDEIAMAAMFTLVASSWFAWRQWRRYAGEMARRINLEGEIIAMRVMADHLGQNKSAFLANLSQDFRAPLNSILGFAQLLEEEPFGPIGNERYKAYVRSIRESAAMLGERITTCLDPDKVEFGAEPMQMKPWPIKELVESAVAIVEPVARTTGIKIEIDVASDLPDMHADERAIKRILVNLVTNAIKFNRPNGIIRITAKLAEGNALTLIVKDNGIGILKDDLDPRGTHPRSSAAHVGPRPQYRVGIGLYAVRTLLEMHGATFVICSVPSKGTTVTMTFPPERLVARGRSQKTLDQVRRAI
jgi:signal transduction histidine kinase